MKPSKIALIYLLSQSACLETTAQLANAPLQRVRRVEPDAKQSFAQRVQASRRLKKSKEEDGPAYGKEQNPPSGSMPLNVAEISMPFIESEMSMPLIESMSVSTPSGMSLKYETAEIAGGYVADDTSAPTASPSSKADDPTPSPLSKAEKSSEVTDEAPTKLVVSTGAVIHMSDGGVSNTEPAMFAKAAKATHATVKQHSAVESGATKHSKARRMKELRTDQKKRNLQGFTWSEESVSMSLPPADIVDSIDSAIPVPEQIGEDAAPVPVVTGKAEKDPKPIVPARMDLLYAIAEGLVPGQLPVPDVPTEAKAGKRERQMKQLRADQK